MNRSRPSGSPTKGAAKKPQRRAEPQRQGDPPHRGASPRPALPPAEGEVTFGARAVIALLRKRPEAVRRLFVSEGFRRAEAGTPAAAVHSELRGLAASGEQHGLQLTYLSDGELEQRSGSSHHEGVVAMAEPRQWMSPSELNQLVVLQKASVLALDRVRNPYNIGALLRSAAFFGVDAVLFGASGPHSGLTAEVARVAEGGAECVRLARTTDLAGTLGRLRTQGVRVYGAENDGSLDARGHCFPRPCVLVMGHEREGLSARVRAECDAMVAIRGSGAVESLNVSIAGSILLFALSGAR